MVGFFYTANMIIEYKDSENLRCATNRAMFRPYLKCTRNESFLNYPK